VAGVLAGVLAEQVWNGEVGGALEPGARDLHPLPGPVEGGGGLQQRVDEGGAGQAQGGAGVQHHLSTGWACLTPVSINLIYFSVLQIWIRKDPKLLPSRIRIRNYLISRIQIQIRNYH